MIAGRYALDREIGRGGMGAVWLARDEVLGRQVALKQIGLLPGADSTDLARAEREARLAARLNHPHVVAVFNLVVDTDSGARWLVMEYVDGVTLAELVRQEGPLAPDDAAPLLGQAADALAAAHAEGVVHRDVKPSNILVDRDRQAKLTDFVIARVAADPALTQTGLLTGSPAYLPPEVAAGERGDESVDVWALGATAFHALSGRPPYDIGDNVLGGLYRIVHEEPPRLPAAGRLAPLLEATLVRDPSQRWRMEQVRDFLAGTSAAQTTTQTTTRATAPATTRATTRATPPSTAPVASYPPEQGPSTRVLGAPAAEPPRSARPRPGALVALLGLALAVVIALVLLTVLPDGEQQAADPDGTASGQSTSPGQDVTAEPTARGMESFIRDYVAALSRDPDTAWQMLTPKFQRESGGLDTYRDFWEDVGDARILDITADPDTLAVSYRVRFENFGTGRRPTVLDLAFDGDRYLIDGERTEGFQPAA